MNPYFEIAGSEVEVFSLLVSVGMLLSISVMAVLARRRSVSVIDLIWIGLILAVVGPVGTRIFFIIQQLALGLGAANWSLVGSPGGSAQYGAIILGVPAFFGYCWLRRCDYKTYGDILAVGIIVIIVIGRLGCYANGCCFGDLYDGPISITFPPGSIPFNTQMSLGLISVSSASSLPVWPTQLLNAGAAAVILVILLILFYRPIGQGRLLFLMLILHTSTRFLLDFLRYEPNRIIGLTFSQISGLVILAVSIILFRSVSSRGQSVE